MLAVLPEIEAWIRVAGLAIGAAVVLIVPATGFMKEYWAYRARIRESDRLRADVARTLSGPALGRTLELADLTTAAQALAAAVGDLATTLDRQRTRRPATDSDASRPPRNGSTCLRASGRSRD